MGLFLDRLPHMDRWIQTDAGGMQVEMKMNGQIHGLIHQKTLIGFREVMEVMKVEVEVEVSVAQVFGHMIYEEARPGSLTGVHVVCM